jgi:hypothetical protein
MSRVRPGMLVLCLLESQYVEGGTRVNLVMSPTPGGLSCVMAPVISKSVARQLPASLAFKAAP